MKSDWGKRPLTRFRKLHYKFHAAAIAGLFIAARLALGGQAHLPSSPEAAISFGGSERYLSHVSTDKPIYRAGEKLYVRAVVLRADDHVPMRVLEGSQDRLLPPRTNGAALIEIKGPKGDMVVSGTSAIIDSTVAFTWDIPAVQAGGEYTIRISHPLTGDAPAVRKFDVRAYRAPRLKSQIVFARDGYGPGDTVTANLHVDRAEGGIPAGAKVSISARVDGVEAWQGETRVDAAGNAGASFKLPAVIARGEGTIAMIIADGGTVETAAKTIPILLQTVDLKVYPEGGDLIAGLLNRVYIEGRTPAGKPADMAGAVLDADGKEVAVFRTQHDGRGRFSFTPAKGERYSLRVTEPAGIKPLFQLPAVKTSGVVIATTTDVIQKQKDVVVRVAATARGTYGIALTQRGKEIAATTVKLKAGTPADVTLTVPRSLDGVITATVYDEFRTPLAERLLFRQPDRALKIKVTADQSDFTPGDKVTLRVSATDDSGKPVGAVVGLTVTDSSVLEMIDKREQAPRLPVMVLLENDVRDLADAHVYLDETNPKAPIATDLLLGTQGWRRFAAVDSTKFIAANGDAARRVLAARVPPSPFYPMRMINTVRDGLSVIDGFNPGGVGSNTIMNPDMIGEIRLILAPVDAEAGRGNGQVPIVRNGREEAIILDEAQLQGLPMVGNDPLTLITTLPGYRANPLGREFDTIGGLPLYMVNTVGNSVRQYVREYAHPLRPNWTEGSRSDFAETVYWNAGLKTDANTGIATVSFNLSDSVTSFRVLTDGFTQEGALGASVSHIESVRPFNIEPKVPLQVTSGDVIQLPIAMINGRNRALPGAAITPKAAAGLTFTPYSNDTVTLGAKERDRRLMRIDIGLDFAGLTDIRLDAEAGPYRDTVSRKLDVQPLGFPYEKSRAGQLDANTSSSFEFTLPAETIAGSVSSNIAVYPTPLASMTAALQALLQQPYGCFEQTSSTSYPMVMAQQYFVTHTGVEPALIEKAKGLLEVSYKRLTGFESRSGGYEWFGADPGHEALTAYGLLQFTDMSQVRNVDSAMLKRTRDWLLGRRDGKGGFKRDDRNHGGTGTAPADTTNAYITWALVESGEKNLNQEIAALKTSANASEDTYVVALAANVLHVTGDRGGARQLLDKLAKAQDRSGSVKGAVTSITRSGGDALAIETTALAVLAWLREPAYASQVEQGARWIVASNKNGRFGSTQSTILALRAVVAYDAAHARPKAPGRIVLTVDDRAIGDPLPFTVDVQGAVVLPDIGRELTAGKHTLTLKMEEGSSMPFAMTVKYHSALPDSSERAQVGIQVALADRQIQEGGITDATVSIANKSNQPIPTPVAIIGIPGGLEVRHDQLKELVKSGKIDAYEVIGREVILYWRFLKASDKFDIPLSLVAAVPGSYTGAASRAYLYYTDEYKEWAPGLKVNITPR